MGDPLHAEKDWMIMGKQDARGLDMGKAIALGAGIGVALGVALGQIAIGVAAGVGVGVAIGAALERRKAGGGGKEE